MRWIFILFNLSFLFSSCAIKTLWQVDDCLVSIILSANTEFIFPPAVIIKSNFNVTGACENCSVHTFFHVFLHNIRRLVFQYSCVTHRGSRFIWLAWPLLVDVVTTYNRCTVYTVCCLQKLQAALIYPK